MMDALPLLLQKGLKNRRAGDGLDDFERDVARRQGGVAKFKGERGGAPLVGLVQRVGRGAGVDAPGADAEGGEGAKRAFVVGGDEAKLDGRAEEGGGEG